MNYQSTSTDIQKKFIERLGLLKQRFIAVHDIECFQMSTTYSCILNSLTVKPALEKHLSEEADGAGMQRLLQIGKLKICGPPFHVSILKG